MKRRVVFGIIVLSVLVFSFSQCFGAEVKFSQDLYKELSRNKNAVPRIEIPEYTKMILANGLTVFLAEAHDLPIVTLKGRIEWGRSLEKPDIAGISDYMTNLMNSDSQTLKEQEMAKYKEKYGLSFAVSDEAESFSFTGNALAPDHDKLLSLAAEVLQRPRFAATTIQRKKIEWQRNLQQAKTDEDALLDQYFYRNIMKGHPYSFSHDFELELTALSHITPESLQAYYDQSFIPNRTILFVYGDFKVAAMQKLIEHYFGGWQKKEVELNPFGVSENTATYNRIILVDKPDATHAKIKMGYSFYNQAFFEDKLRDKVALNIANQIFGGGDFESLLMNEIRVKRGYAYDIDSEITYLPLGGTFSVSTSVNPDKAFETVEAVRKIMTDLMAGKLKMSDAEVFKEINRFNALLPESYRDRDSLIWDTIVNTEVKKRDKNYINQYIQLYNEVTAEKAEQAFTKYFFPEKLFAVIVGNKETVLPQLKEAGVTVELIEVR